MAVPPPYKAPKSGNKTGLIIGLVVGAVLLCCILPLGGMFFAGNWALTRGANFLTCSLSFNNVPEAIEAYAKANGGKLPNAATWMDDVRPYYAEIVKKQKADAGPLKFMDPNEAWGCTEGELKTGIAFNADLSGKSLDSIENKAGTVLIFETPKTGMNLAEKYVAPKFDESPNLMGMNKKRGWYVATADGIAALVDEDGNRAKVDTKSGGSAGASKLGPIEIKTEESKAKDSGN